MSERVSSFKRLRDLPALFSLHDLRMTGMPPGTERNAVSRWKSYGMIAEAGPRLGRYYNLVVEPNAPELMRGDVVRAEFGAAIVIGLTVLHDRHWTNQIPAALSVAVPPSRTRPQINGVATYVRPPEWYAMVRAAVVAGERGPYDLYALPPEWALADMLKHGDCRHGLQPDDVEVPEEEMDAALLAEAFDALEVPGDVSAPWTRGQAPRLR
jgi:hypothetical protein